MKRLEFMRRRLHLAYSPYFEDGLSADAEAVRWTGAACLSNDGKLLTLTLRTTDPSFFGGGTDVIDHIELCPLAATQGCPASSGQFDHGSHFNGPAVVVTCTTALSTIPSTHD